MKLSLLLLALLSTIHPNQEEKFPKEFKIGVHTYVMTIKKSHHYDNDVATTYFVVNRKGNKNHQISSHKLAGYNGKNTTNGSYRITKRFVEFKEVYSGRSMDSMTKRFYPNKLGNLILTEYTAYKDGIGKRTRL